ncbi:DgyrCDS9715 [Dimorphilus gyrociliatus]|nr:DgyrCDS9715 [Dimorphilus gyrociliatus]
MMFHDHAILLPCGLDAFNGVEFVCCPKAAKTDLNTGEDKKVTDGEKKKDLYQVYLEDDSPSEFRNEHEYFMKAKHDLEKQQHKKIANMMRDWTNERQRVDSLKKTRGQAEIDKLTQEMTVKYQKIYTDLEKTYAEEKSTFLKKHEVRVERRLDEKKHEAMKAVLAVVDKKKVNYEEVRKSMAKFIRTEMKDQEHYINRWIHLQRTDKQAAEKVLKLYLDKIEMSNERIDQTRSFAIDHLNTDDAEELKLFCEEFIKEYADVAEGRQWMLAATPQPTTEKPVEKEIIENVPDTDKKDDEDLDNNDDDDEYDDEDDEDFDLDDEEDDDDDDDEDLDDDVKTNDDDFDGDDDDEFDYDDEDDDEDDEGDFKLVDGDADKKEDAPAERLNGLDDGDDDEDDNDIFEDTREKDDEFGRDDDNVRMNEEDIGDKYVDNKEIEMDRISSAHVAKLSAHHPDRVVLGRDVATTHNAWVICVVAFAGAAMLGIIVVAAVMKHKRQMKRQRIARVEAESCVMDVEKRHLTTMQCNGYENPTYKYLETGTQ